MLPDLNLVSGSGLKMLPNLISTRPNTIFVGIVSPSLNLAQRSSYYQNLKTHHFAKILKVQARIGAKVAATTAVSH